MIARDEEQRTPERPFPRPLRNAPAASGFRGRPGWHPTILGHKPMHRSACLLLLVWLVAPSALRAQQPGPMTPPPSVDVKEIPLHPIPGSPPIPVKEIIQRFAANESRFRQAFREYTYTETVHVQELGENGIPMGEYRFTGKSYVRPGGERDEQVVGHPLNTLRTLSFSLEDVEVIASVPRFPLTSDQIADYNLVYKGMEKIDFVHTYIFGVEPKQKKPGRAYFSGVVWVDRHDLAIVKSYGKFVTAETPRGPRLPFSMFETYCENIDGKYWFPTYTSSDDVIRSGSEEIPVRLIVRLKDLQAAPAGAAPASAGSPPER
jgi:hypothetical protein